MCIGYGYALDTHLIRQLAYRLRWRSFKPLTRSSIYGYTQILHKYVPWTTPWGNSICGPLHEGIRIIGDMVYREPQNTNLIFLRPARIDHREMRLSTFTIYKTQYSIESDCFSLVGRYYCYCIAHTFMRWRGKQNWTSKEMLRRRFSPQQAGPVGFEIRH